MNWSISFLRRHISSVFRQFPLLLLSYIISLRLSWVKGELTVALDGSKLRTTEKYSGRGCLKVEREVKEKGTKRLVKVVEYVYGWKVLVLIEVQTRLPLAMKVVPIQAYEGQYLLPLVKQAQANLGTYAHISKVVVDRGYLDGEIGRAHV